MNIRIATTEDIDALVALSYHVQSLHATAFPSMFRNSPPADEISAAFRRMIEAPNALWLIAEDKEAIGYLFAEFNDKSTSWVWRSHKICYINHLVVHPSARRKGVAKQLLTALVDKARARGYERIDLDVWSFNRDAKAAFNKLGFEVYNERMTLKKKLS